MNAIVLFAHGSRDPAWIAPAEAVAERLRARGRVVAVAVMENGPGLNEVGAQLIAQGATSVLVLPMLLAGGGRHLREDVPKATAELQAAHPTVRIEARDVALGAEAEVLDALAAAAERLSSPQP